MTAAKAIIISCMPDMRLSILHTLSHYILALRSRSYYYLYFTDGKKETQSYIDTQLINSKSEI